jgi:hypothetical protein
MAKINVHAGDFHKGKGSQFLNGFLLADTGKRNWIGNPKWERIAAKEFETLEVASEENVKRLGGTVGWGVAGAVLLGPVGLLVGLLAGGKKKEVTFILRLQDGRKILASTNSKCFTAMQSAIF